METPNQSRELDDIKEPVACGLRPDLTFEFGKLKLLAGHSWKAVSGSRTLQPLPAGWYECRNLRKRTEKAMVRDGVGFSVDLEPLFPTTRTLLRIHPDGNLPGTEGCIGITDPDVAGCYKALQQLLPNPNSVAHLLVRTTI